MPELPEVETVRRGLVRLLSGREVRACEVREPRLRRFPAGLADLSGVRLSGFRRRAKYLLADLDGPAGAPRGLLAHLGMTGRLRVVAEGAPLARHDHLRFHLDGDEELRYEDARRFGFVLATPGPPDDHPALAGLGREPLDPDFDGAALHAVCRDCRSPVKVRIMDQRQVVGVGNIYASEALFRAGIHPRRPARRIAATRLDLLADAIAGVLRDAIEGGGATLRDYRDAAGRPGRYAVRLRVYGRTGEPCRSCGTAIRREVTGGRATYFCPRCQR